MDRSAISYIESAINQALGEIGEHPFVQRASESTLLSQKEVAQWTIRWLRGEECFQILLVNTIAHAHREKVWRDEFKIILDTFLIIEADGHKNRSQAQSRGMLLQMNNLVAAYDAYTPETELRVAYRIMDEGVDAFLGYAFAYEKIKEFILPSLWRHLRLPPEPFYDLSYTFVNEIRNAISKRPNSAAMHLEAGLLVCIEATQALFNQLNDLGGATRHS